MTTYLWYSNEAAARDRENGPKQRFNDAAAGSDNGVFYLNSKDWPVAVSFVTHKPEHGSGFTDIQLLDTVDGDARCVMVRGALQAGGREWCMRRGITPDAANFFKHCNGIVIHKPLTFKAKPSQ